MVNPVSSIVDVQLTLWRVHPMLYTSLYQGPLRNHLHGVPCTVPDGPGVRHDQLPTDQIMRQMYVRSFAARTIKEPQHGTYLRQYTGGVFGPEA
jgi:hypothetical protein